MLASEPVSRLSTQIDAVALREQRLTEVGAEEAGAAGYDRGWHRCILAMAGMEDDPTLQNAYRR